MSIPKGTKRGKYRTKKKKILQIQGLETPSSPISGSPNNEPKTTKSEEVLEASPALANDQGEIDKVASELEARGINAPEEPSLDSEESSKPRVSKKALREQREQFQATLETLVPFLADFMASRMPNPIPATQSEKDFLSSSISPLIMKYIPDIGGMQEEIVAVIAIGAFTLPRLVKEKKENPPVESAQ